MTDWLSPAELARGEMAAAGIGQPTMAELVVALRDLADGPVRALLEEWYWALEAEKHGPVRADWYRKEYAWLRSHRATSSPS